MTFSNLTYAGEHFLETFGPAVLDPAGLLENNLATIIDQTKFKSTINEADDTVVLQNPSSDFNDQNTTADIDEVNLQTIPYEFHKKLSFDEIRKSWYSGGLPAGSLNDYDDAGQLADMYVNKVYVPKLKLAQANLVLNGKQGLDASVGSYTFSAAYSGLYTLLNGLAGTLKASLQADQITVASVAKGTTTTLTLASGSAALTKLFPGNVVSIRLAAGTGWTALNGDYTILSVNSDTSITIDVDTDDLTNVNYTANSARVRYINRTNIVRIMANHLGLVPAVIRRSGAAIVIPESLEMEWQFANAEASQNGGQFYLTAYQMQMISQRIVVLDLAPANTIGTWASDAVYYGFDLEGDYSNVELLWQGATGNKNYHLRAAMKTGVAITKKFPRKITLTTPEL